jgi:putative chitinase
MRVWAILACVIVAVVAIVFIVAGRGHSSPGPVAGASPSGSSTGSPSVQLASTCASALSQLSASPSSAAALMPNLSNGALAQSIFDHNQLAYVLATAEWETGHFATMYEYYNSADDLNQAYDGEIGNGAYPSNDGFTYRGRGYVQLTGRANYQQMGTLLNLDLIDNPDQAADPFIAGEIAAIGMSKGLFTGVSLGNYISPPTTDFVGARAIVNDHDQDTTIAGYATNFAGALQACGESFLK